jgi:transcriptional regulator with XRE-family HTH domain
MTLAQARAARLLLGWAAMRVGGEVGLSETTLSMFERGVRTPKSA